MAPTAVLILPERLHDPATQRVARAAGRSVPRTLRQPIPSVNRGSLTAVPPSRAPFTFSERLGLTGEFLGRHDCHW